MSKKISGFVVWVSFFLQVVAAGSVLADMSDQYECLIEPYQLVKISSPVKGVIDKVHVDNSDLVEAGQVLVELESSVEKATVETARVRATSSGELKARNADLEFKKRQAKRLKELLSKKAVSSHEKDQADNEVTLAYMEVRKAKEEKHLAEMQLKQAKAVLGQRIIRSPFSGVVVDRFLSAGEFVSEEPVLSLAQLNPLRVEVILPSHLFGTIKPDMNVQVSVESPVDRILPARVQTVDRVIDGASGTFIVRLEVANPDYELPGGLKCTADFSASPVAAK